MSRPTQQSRIPIYAAVAFAFAMSPLTGHAHLNSTGMGPIYDGLMHFLMSPEDLVPVLALALLSGLRGATFGRRTLFVLPAAWLLGGLAGLAASATNGNAVVSAVWFLLMGGLLALDARLSLRVTTAIAAFLGLYHGYLNGAGLGLSFSSAAALL
ncbi:MAG TPA: HupE/UreJ family protein, partial [Candidatus Methylomirabilis sp.]|nr:HupE/UreJ family protein [Candidatus Methylomirabilis sp.]